MQAQQDELDAERRRCAALLAQPPPPEALRFAAERASSRWTDGGVPTTSPRVDRALQRLDAGVEVKGRAVARAAIDTFSTPPGDLFVPTSLLDDATTDDALAGFVAHELGHLAQQDFVRSVQRALVERCEFDSTSRAMQRLLRETGQSATPETGGAPSASLLEQVELVAPVDEGAETLADTYALELLDRARIDAGPWAAALTRTAPLATRHLVTPSRLEALERIRRRLPPPPPPPRRRR